MLVDLSDDHFLVHLCKVEEEYSTTIGVHMQMQVCVHTLVKFYFWALQHAFNKNLIGHCDLNFMVCWLAKF